MTVPFFTIIRNTRALAGVFFTNQKCRQGSLALFQRSSATSFKILSGQGTTTTARPTLVLSGILAMLGLKDKSKVAEESDEEKLIKSIKLGILAMQQGDFEKSEFLLHVALKMAQDLQHDNGIYYIYTILGDLAFKQGDFSKCKKLYLDVMKREVGRGVPKNANSLVEISLKLAQIYAFRNEPKKAEQGFLFCIASQEEKLKNGANAGEDLEDVLGLWGMSRDQYAQFLMQQRRYSEAFNQFQKSFRICCDVYGENHPQALVLLNSLGTVASMMGKDDEAVSYFDKAIRLARESDSSDLATFLVNLGMAKIKKNLLKEAHAACNEAFQLAARKKSKEEMEEAENCLNLSKDRQKSPSQTTKKQ